MPSAMLPMVRALSLSVAISGALLTGASASDDDGGRYLACLDLAARNPASAVREADAWQTYERGGAAAMHCRAVALVELGAVRTAIDALLALAADGTALPASVRAGLMVQAGSLLLDEGDAAAAGAVADEALRLDGRDGTAFALRGDSRLRRGDALAAIADFDDALARRPGDMDVRLLRATALRKTGQVRAAATDVETVIAANPEDPRGWLERGQIERMRGDEQAARQALMQAIALDRTGPVGGLAKRALQRMDMRFGD